SRFQLRHRLLQRRVQRVQDGLGLRLVLRGREQPAEERGLFQHETPYQARMITDQEQGDQATVRMADEVDWPHGQRLDQRGDVGRVDLRPVVGLVASHGVGVMIAEADGDDAMGSAERLYLGCPGPVVAQRTVHEDERWPLALLDVGQTRAMHRERLDLWGSRSISANAQHEAERDEHEPSQSLHTTPSSRWWSTRLGARSGLRRSQQQALAYSAGGAGHGPPEGIAAIVTLVLS